MRFIAILSVLLVSACGKGDKANVNKADFFSDREKEYTDALFSKYVNEYGFVGTYNEDEQKLGSLGDSLLFTGVAMYALPCDKAEVLFGAYKKLWAEVGTFERSYPLAQEYRDKNNELSRDGVTGALLGLQKMWRECGNSDAESIMKSYSGKYENKSHLHPAKGGSSLNTPSFNVYLKAVGRDKNINNLEKTLFYSGMAITAKGIVESKTACFPIHLQTLENIALDITGEGVFSNQRKEWCSMVKGKGLPLTDWYCGAPKEEITSWLEQSDYPHNYEHQRCDWEKPSSPSRSYARIDWLLMYKLLNKGI